MKGLMSYKKVNIENSYKQIIISNIVTLFNIINLFLACLLLFNKDIKGVIFIIIPIINTIINIVQEVYSKYKLDNLLNNKVCVIRNDKEEYININEIEVNDIVKYNKNDIVLTNGTIISKNIDIDESLVNGKTNIISKKEGDNLLLGSKIISGNALIKVDSINNNTNYIKNNNYEIIDTLDLLIKIVSVLIIPMGILFYVKQINIESISESITSTVFALIGIIPEGLIILSTIVLMLAFIRLMRNKILVKRSKDIELLAHADIICFDKTGTITENNIKVEDVVTLDNDYDIDIIMKNICYHDDNKVLVNYFKKDDSYKFIKMTTNLKYTKYEFKDNTFILGKIDNMKYEGNIPNIEEYISNYKVLLLCDNNKPIGLILISEVVRNNTVETIKYLLKQDIDIKIISGDTYNNVVMIAKRIGLDNVKAIDINTKDIDYNEYNVFTNATSEDKKNIILELKKYNQRVAYIGDGINDIEALKVADCGISVSNIKEVCDNSDIVLLDSNINNLKNTINEGRKVINNLERSSSLFIIKCIYAFTLILSFLLVNGDYPFIPKQLMIINALTITIPAFVLALEPNYDKVHGKFINNIIIKSLPTAVNVILNIIVLLVISKIFNIDIEYTSTICIITVAIIDFILLYKICKPFNYPRTILFGFLLVLFIICIFTMNNIFELFIPDPLHILFIVILCFIYIIVYNLLTNIIYKKLS